jgi:hypothetical protein
MKRWRYSKQAGIAKAVKMNSAKRLAFGVGFWHPFRFGSVGSLSRESKRLCGSILLLMMGIGETEPITSLGATTRHPSFSRIPPIDRSEKVLVRSYLAPVNLAHANVGRSASLWFSREACVRIRETGLKIFSAQVGVTGWGCNFSNAVRRRNDGPD